MTETAWEEVQDSPRVELVEEFVKDAYSIFKNSACRTLRLAEIGRIIEEKTVKPQGIFEIKYLTSEESATDATLKDYLQIMKLTQELKDDKSIKRDTRKKMKKIHNRTRDARTLINTIALNSLLKKGVSPYQTWGQTMKACAFERFHKKSSMYQTLEVMDTQKVLSKDVIHLLKNIDYDQKKWKKVNVDVSYIPESLEDAKLKDLKARAEMSKKFRAAKERIHKENDPSFLKDLSQVFDMKNYASVEFESDEKFKKLVDNCMQKMIKHQYFFKVLDLGKIEIGFKVSLNIVKNKGLLQFLKKENHIIDQW